MLHVTNGSSVSLDRTGIGGEIVVWADVLHEGPVPAGLDDRELRHLRGLFLDAALGAADPGAPAEEALARRDEALERCAAHDEVTLWFEHDLFDQLQLIQILDRLRARVSATHLTMISVDRYLGPLTGEELAALWPVRRAVTGAELELAAAAWAAFRSPDPMDLMRLVDGATSALPFLAAALKRHLQEFPSVQTGLSRTQRQTLEAAAAEPGRRFHDLFQANQRREESIFMGDAPFGLHVRSLTECREPLLARDEAGFRVTAAGREVLGARADHVRLNGINRWLGGVHLSGTEVLWRWDERAARLVAH